MGLGCSRAWPASHLGARALRQHLQGTHDPWAPPSKFRVAGRSTPRRTNPVVSARFVHAEDVLIIRRAASGAVVQTAPPRAAEGERCGSGWDRVAHVTRELTDPGPLPFVAGPSAGPQRSLGQGTHPGLWKKAPPLVAERSPPQRKLVTGAPPELYRIFTQPLPELRLGQVPFCYEGTDECC